LGYQRNVHDLFIPNDLREELQKNGSSQPGQGVGCLQVRQHEHKLLSVAVQHTRESPHSQNTLGYQRNVHDLFIPNDLREELQKKSAATKEIMHVALVSQCVLAVRANWGIKMVLDLLGC
jgi:predicted nucleotidyltransferase